MKINRHLGGMTSAWMENLASVELTLVCLGLAMILVILGTLAQIHMGTFAAQKEFFNSWWVFASFGDLKVPAFPGGLTIGAAWMINLLAAFAARFQFRRKDAGILISHFGLILLLFGQCLTQRLSRESNLPIEVGQTRNYSESFGEPELALIMTSDPQTDQVTSIPYSFFRRESPIALPGLPFSLVIRKFYANARLGMAPPGQTPIATQGIGTRIAVQEVPPVSSDDEMNAVDRVYRSPGRRRTASERGWSRPVSARRNLSTYRERITEITIRPQRHYYPFSLTLKEFDHDIYPGTDIPKNFSSLVHLDNPRQGESRDALIYMNHPLRYEGKTFYQASFGKGDRMSVFQVMDNPASWAPYISCALIVLGLLIEFLSHLFDFLRKRR